MKRIVSVFCSLIILLSTCSGYVTIEKDSIKEEILSFNFNNEEKELTEHIDVSRYDNLEIVEYGMNNGKVKVSLEDDDVVLELYDGRYSKGKEKREKIKTQDIAVSNNQYYFEPEDEVKTIIDYDGDFKNVTLKNGMIVLEINEDAKGENGYNKENIVKSEIKVEVPEENNNQTVYSEFYSLEERPKNGSIKVEGVNLDGNATLEVDGNAIRVLFEDGIPNIEETTRKDSHSYFWVDRALDGTFREKYPNSVYRTDRYYFEGRGEYVDDKRLAMDIPFKDEWQDYVGFVIDNQKYVYPLKGELPKELFKDCIIMKDNSIEFQKYWMNTEELTVEITDDSVRYIPKGILYSMGELVAYSKDWGETVPNNPEESKESFYNNISGRMETYVKHFKFFYGPKQKETFGGNLKYPYKATIEYEHYEPAILYSGSVTYKYEELEEVDGYLFDGWIKIKYTEKENVIDYPPMAPYNVFYNNLSKKLSWTAGKDDYTKPQKLVYEVEVKVADGFEKVSEIIGETNISYENGKGYEFRVRARDEQKQLSEWAYSNDSKIEVTAEVLPQVVNPGETIKISAIVKSLNEVQQVLAISEELDIEELLAKETEKCPNGTEIAFSLLNCNAKEPSLVVNNMYYAEVDSDKKIDVKRYGIKEDTEKTTLVIDIPNNIKFTDNGTIILPNNNYLDYPIEIHRFENNWWYFYSMCDLKFINKNTEKEESFISFVNDTTVTRYQMEKKVDINPYIKINLFEYIEETPTYEKIPISVELAGKPITIVWNSQNNLTKFTIYVDNSYFYSYEVETNKVKDNLGEFSKYYLARSMDKMIKYTFGYSYHYKSKRYYWANMYKSGNVLKLPFLGHKFSNPNDNETLEKYNNMSTTRDVNRMIFLDEDISLETIKLYLEKIKTTNVMMLKRLETIFVKDIQEIKSKFSKGNIRIPEDTSNGIYDIVIFAVDKMGNRGFTTVQIMVEENENTKIEKEDINIGRFLYVDNNANKKAVEELSLTKHNLNTKGFISAGETLAIVFDEEISVDNIVIDIEGDESIKKYDKLTKTFLEKNPDKHGMEVGNIEKNYNFPVTLYPNEDGIFLYTIPYGTKQTLDSWYTLREKSEDYESLDTQQLFNRISEPYKINIYVNGNDENVISFEFDVFERWDTILNRDASRYIVNSGAKWRISL